MKHACYKEKMCKQFPSENRNEGNGQHETTRFKWRITLHWLLKNMAIEMELEWFVSWQERGVGHCE